MVALTTSELGLLDINNKTTGSVGGSVRGRDRDDQQRLGFMGDSAAPISGTIHIQGTVSKETMPADKIIWFDIVEVDLENEGGNWSVEFVGEFMSLRATIKDKNLHAANHSGVGRTVITTGTFTINGISIVANSGETLTDIMNRINADAAIQTAGNIIAKIVTIPSLGDVLKIYTNDGTDLVLAEGTNTPLNDLGFTAGTYKTGRIKTIQLLR